MPPPPPASLVITTRNRKSELREALRSALQQSVPLEIIVIDDHSDDGTPDMVRAEFPSVKIVNHPQRAGYIVLRNLGMRLASNPIVISIDDDAIFTTPYVVEQTLREFNPRIAAVAMPYADIRIDPNVHQRAPSPDGIYVTDWFIGTAHAIRKDVFLKVGGYREFFIHQGEEVDLCARMLARGYVTRRGNADPVHHLVSPRRDMQRMHYFGTRNNVLMMWLCIPAICLLPHFAVSMCHTFVHAARIKALRIKLVAMLAGIAVSFRHWADRQPVSLRTYKLLRQLRRHPQLLNQIESLLAPIPEFASRSPQTSQPINKPTWTPQPAAA